MWDCVLYFFCVRCLRYRQLRLIGLSSLRVATKRCGAMRQTSLTSLMLFDDSKLLCSLS